MRTRKQISAKEARLEALEDELVDKEAALIAGEMTARERLVLVVEIKDLVEHRHRLESEIVELLVLRAEREPWLVIDPKPFVGDPCYDATQHLLNCEDRLQARPRELIERFAGTGESPIVYCGSGVTACHNLLVMSQIGLHGARLYPGSWSEWSADPERPVAVGDEPA